MTLSGRTPSLPNFHQMTLNKKMKRSATTADTQETPPAFSALYVGQAFVKKTMNHQAILRMRCILTLPPLLQLSVIQPIRSERNLSQKVPL